MSPFVIRWLVATLAVGIVSSIHGTGVWADSFLSLMAAGLLLGMLNASVRPLLMMLSLPLIVLTLGVFILILNAVILWMVGGLIPGFHVAGFGAAFFSSILISLISWPLNAFFRGNETSVRMVTRESVLPPNEPNEPNEANESGRPPMKKVEGRVIE